MNKFVQPGCVPGDFPPDDFNALVRKVVAALRRLGYSWDEAEDFVAVALAKWVRVGIRVRHPYPWLLRQATFIALNARLKDRRRERLLGPRIDLDSVAAPEPTDLVVLRDELALAAGRLSAAHQRMIRYLLDEFSVAQMAGEMDLHPDVVAALLHGAIARLRAVMGERG